MNRILFPTDLSAESNNAVRYAAKLCQRVGAHLTIFNIQSVWNMTASEIVRGKALTVQMVDDNLSNLSDEISRVFKISCSSMVLEDNRSIAQTIAKAGGDHQLIVMVVHETADVFKAISGSTAYQVSKESPLPLLLLPAKCEYTDMQELVFAADYLHDNTLHYVQLAYWATLLKLYVTILQVVTEPYRHEDDTTLLMNQKRLAKVLPKEMSFKFRTIYEDTVINGISSYVEQTEVDAIALSTRHHSLFTNIFHKSVIKEISFASHYPLFVFHH